jgi:hypothetical protein
MRTTPRGIRATLHSIGCGARTCAHGCGAFAGTESFPMLDILMVVIALAFFALSVGYAYACDRL